jgi:DNA-binding NtrC family response regulator
MDKSAKPSFQLKVLYGEGDPEVVAAQAIAIEKAGHHVETAVGRKGVEQALQRGNYDLVVIGPTLTKNDRHHLPYMVKKQSSVTRVLVMHTDGERHPYVDGNIDTGRTIEDLVKKIAEMMSKGAMAKRAAAGN